MAHFRRIVCASDFSRASSRAFVTAVAMAKAHRARLTLLHVIEPVMPIIPEQYIASTTWEQVDAGTRRWATGQLARLAEKAKKKGVRVATRLIEGFVADEIARVARSERADLLVVGTHGRRGISRLVLGSVAERVVAIAHCPVVTCR